MMRVFSDVFPAHVLPVRDGWYLHKTRGAGLFSVREFRDGAWRWLNDDSPMGMNMFDCWQGLAFDPAAAEPCNVDAGWMHTVGRAGVFVPGATTCE